jgi:acyl-CoA synthetase (AMP-forming)/AMP-acid ligase II
MVAGIADKARSAPGEWALADERVTLSWSQLNDQVNRAVNVLLRADLGPCRRVAIMAENSAECAIAHLAGILAGACVVPVNCRLRPQEAGYIVRDCGARLVLTGPESAAAARQAAPSGTRVLAWRSGRQPGVEPFAAEAEQAGGDEPPASLVPRRSMLYTSGTSGVPKATELPLTMFAGGATIAEHVANLAKAAAGRPGPHLVCGPMHHTGPLSGLRHLAAGSQTAVLRRFGAQAALAAIERHQIASSVMVPTHFVRLLSLPAEVRKRYDVSSLQLIVHTGAACPVDVKHAMIRWFGPVFTEAYGATEIGTVTLIGSADWLEHPGSVGRAVPPFEITIRDAHGTVLPAGAEGLVCVRNADGTGPRYLDDPAKTAASYLAPGIFMTGEIGVMDHDGYLYLTERASDLVVSGGVNVYPAEAEAVLAAHPGVRDVAVIGIPDAEMGESLRALVVPGAGEPTAAELISWCRERLTHYKCPRSVEFTQSLPRSAMGKLNKRELRARYAPEPAR